MKKNTCCEEHKKAIKLQKEPVLDKKEQVTFNQYFKEIFTTMLELEKKNRAGPLKSALV